MRLEEFESKYVANAFAAGCVYESVAILSGKVPTISSLIRLLYKNELGRVAIWLAFGWFVAHIFTPILREEDGS